MLVGIEEMAEETIGIINKIRDEIVTRERIYKNERLFKIIKETDRY